MAVEKTATSAQAVLKDVYGTVQDANSEFAHLQRDIPFKKEKRIGNAYHHPVRLRHSHGVTVAGGSSLGSAFDTNDPISLVYQDSSIVGHETLIQEDVAYGMISSARDRGQASFVNMLKDALVSTKRAAQLYVEMSCLYGGSNIGVVSGTPSVSGATADFVINSADWIPGLWGQMENAKIDVYDTTGATKRNSNAFIQVTGVDADTRTISVSGNATDLGNLANTDIVVPIGHQGAWSDGLDILCSEKTAAVQGITSSSYTLWQPSTHSNGDAKLAMSGLQRGLTKIANRGTPGPLCAWVNPFTWTDLNDDLAGLRRFSEDTRSEMVQGTMSIRYYGVHGSYIEIIPHQFVKLSEAFIAPKKQLMRVGSTDVTSNLDTGKGTDEGFMQHLESKAGLRFRSYSHQGLGAQTRHMFCKITNIVPSAS